MTQNRTLQNLVIVLLIHSLSAFVFAGDWPQWRGVQRDGYSTDTGLLKKWPDKGPNLAWKTKGVGGGFSSVSVANGSIYTMGDLDGACQVIALNESDGRERWSTDVGKPGGHKKYPGPRCTPTVDGNRLYIISQHGDLVCLESGTGREVWRKSLPGD